MPLIPTPRRQLIAAGATADRLDADLRSGRSVAAFRGVHVDAAHATGFLSRLRAAAATQAVGAMVAMQTSAILHALRWLPSEWSSRDATLHFAVDPADKKRDRPGLKLHRRTLAAQDIVVVHGILCMSVARTLVEFARDTTLAPLLVVQIIDGALRDSRTTQQELFECLDRLSGGRGVARARTLIARSRVGVDSPPETTMRLTLEDGGITGIEVNIRLCNDYGDLLARGDLGIKDLLIWGEYDGFVPHTERETFRKDRPRHRWLDRRGWNVMRFVDTDLARPANICAEWRQAIADAPARILALDPTRSPEIAAAWRALGFGS